MSSQYAAEQLTKEIINSVLRLLSGVNVKNKTYLKSEIRSRLSSEQWSRVEKKGGDREIARILGYMKSQQLIEGSPSKPHVDPLSLSKRGEERLLSLNFDTIIANTDSWDGLWRIVMFDIPEHKRGARDAIRRLLKQLGFKQIQRSVWIHPLPCFEQFQQIRNTYGIDSHLQLAEATFAGDFHDKYCAMFKKTYPKIF